MKLHLGETVFGIHNVSGAAGSTYHLTIRDFDPLNGYCSCPDFRTNKLGFCKHLLFAANQIQGKKALRQRIGRVHRLGQKSDHITVINLVAQNSIEARIAEGIVLKSSLFDAVLNEKNQNDEVDFSRRGRATFIQELQELISGLEIQTVAESVETETTMDDSREETRIESEEEEKLPVEPASTVDHAVLQQTLDQGLQFLNGIFKMATGHSLLTEQQTIAIDAETGEVTIKFKLPKISK